MLDYEEQYRREQEELRQFEEAHKDEVIVVEDDIILYAGREPDYDDDLDYGYPDMYLGDKRSEITGNLKDMILKRVGIDTSFGTLNHKVEIIESHESSGGCSTCVFEYLVFSILVDDETVYTEGYSSDPFGILQDWLTEED